MQESVRLYLRELRDKQGITQQDAADTIGLSLRAFSDWETGKSSDLKFRFLVRLIKLLNASWDDISHLELHNAEASEGAKYAVNRINNKSSNLDEEIESLIHHIASDKELMKAFISFWSGWKARELN